MSKDKRAEIVEAIAREMCRTLAPCASMVAEIMDDATYLRGHEGDAAALTLAGQLRIQVEAALDIAGKAFAEVVYVKAAGQSDWPEGPESYQSGYTVGAQHAASAILALTSEGVKE